MSGWSTQPILGSYWIVAAIGAALTLLLVVRPSFGQLRRSRQLVLLALRIAVIAMLIVAMLRPTRVSSTSTPQSAVLIILIDSSRSMTLPNTNEQATRWEAQLRTLRNSEPLLRALNNDLELRFYRYDSELHTIDFDGQQLALPNAAQGEQTDIGSTLHEAVRREWGKRLAGVVLLGDGTQTAYDPKIEMMDAGRELRRLDYPLYTVAFGPTGDNAQSRDVAIENLPEQYTVFAKNELVVRSQLRVRGLLNKPIPVEMWIQDATGNETRVGVQEVTARQDNEQVSFEMNYLPETPGQYKLSLRAAEQPGELVTKNNQLTAFLTVLDGGLRVLYLKSLGFEYGRIGRSLDASPDIQLDEKIVFPFTRDDWPLDFSNELEQDYDVVMLGNLDARVFREQDLQKLEQLVGSGKGLIMLGGRHSFGAGGYRETPLADVLPLTFDRFEKQDFDAPLRADLHVQNQPADPNDLRLVPLTLHPVTTLGTPDQNEGIWRQLPELKWSNKFHGIKQTPGTRVLLATPQEVPVLISGEYGQGRVLAFGGDSTYLWVSRGFESEHKRFWRQVILWLSQRDDLDRRDVWIQLPQRRFNPGAQVKFECGAKTATGEDVRDAQFAAKLTLPDQSVQDISLSRAKEGLTGLIAKVQQPGEYGLQVTVTQNDRQLGQAEVSFQILDQDLELSHPAADHAQLARLASMTSAAGGKAIGPEDLPKLLQQIKEQPPEMRLDVETKWQLADTWWDAWLFFAGFVALLSVEWALRKTWGLV